MKLTCDLCGHSDPDWRGFSLADPIRPGAEGQVICSRCSRAWGVRTALAWQLFCAAMRGKYDPHP